MFNIIVRTFISDLYLSSINFGRVDEIQTEFGLEFAFGYIIECFAEPLKCFELCIKIFCLPVEMLWPMC